MDCNSEDWQRLKIAARTKNGQMVFEYQLIFLTLSLFLIFWMLVDLRFKYMPVAATKAKNENT